MIKKTIAMMLVIMLAYTMLPWAGVPTGFTVARAAMETDGEATVSDWAGIVALGDNEELLDGYNPDAYAKKIWYHPSGRYLFVGKDATLEIAGTIVVQKSLKIIGGGTIKRAEHFNNTNGEELFKLSGIGSASFVTGDITIDGGNGGAGALISVPHAASGGWTVEVGRNPFTSEIYDLTILKNNGGPAIEVTQSTNDRTATIKLYNAEFGEDTKAVAAAESDENVPGAINLRIYPDYFTKSTTIDLSGLTKDQIATVDKIRPNQLMVQGEEKTSPSAEPKVTIKPWTGAEPGDYFGAIKNNRDNDNTEKVFNYPRLAVDGFEIDATHYYSGAFYLKLGDKKSGGNGDSDNTPPRAGVLACDRHLR